MIGRIVTIVLLGALLTAATVRAEDESIYQLEAPLVDQHGERVGLDVFRGHPVLVTMFYGRCPHACPLLINDLKRVEAQLSERARGEVRVLLISFDAAQDTPAALQRLAELHAADPARWRLTAAAEPGTREIAAVLGVRYRRNDDGSYGHSSVITLLDAAGGIAARREGAAPVEELVGRVEALVAGGRGTAE